MRVRPPPRARGAGVAGDRDAHEGVAVLLDLSDGRRLEFAVAGPAGGMPLVFHHGTPGAAVLFEPVVAAAVRHGLRAVVYGRPGYGGPRVRTRRPGADAAPAPP